MERLGLTVGDSGSLLALASKVVGGRDDSPFGSTPINLDGAVVQVESVSSGSRGTPRVAVVLASGEPAFDGTRIVVRALKELKLAAHETVLEVAQAAPDAAAARERLSAAAAFEAQQQLEQQRAIGRLVALRLEAAKAAQPADLLLAERATLERGERARPLDGEQQQPGAQVVLVQLAKCGELIDAPARS